MLVTGHTGFKGSWLSLWLQDMGAEVGGFALAPPTQPSLYEAAHVGDGMHTVCSDVRGLDDVVATFAEFEPEVVMHLAAQPIVSRSFKDPVPTFDVNVMGVVNVLDAARRSPSVRVIVNVTSDKVYENRESPRGYRERDALGGHDAYSASKACSELVTAAYRRSFFNGPGTAAVATARAGNVIGGGDWGEDRLIPDIMKAALGGTTAAIRRPAAVRPWQHVLNPLSGYLLLAERLWAAGDEFADAWNFAADEDEAWPVGEVVDRLVELWGESIPVERGVQADFEETHYLKLDSSRARSGLGWVPGLRIEQALAAVVDWYREWGAGTDPRQLTVDQIRAYPAAAASRASA